jgi:hypothetical protein
MIYIYVVRVCLVATVRVSLSYRVSVTVSSVGTGHKQVIPDVVLVRKQFPTKGERKWLLKQMDLDERYSKGPGEGPAVEKEREKEREQGGGRGKKGTNKERADADLAAEEYEEFMEELEHDRDMRKHINLYKKPKKVGRFKGEKGSRTAVDMAESSSAAMDEDGEWEDVDDDDDDADEDDVQLDELLDELVVSERIQEQVDSMGAGAAAPLLTTEQAEEDVRKGGSFVVKK